MSGIKDSFPVVLGLIAIGVIVGVVFTTGFNIDNKGFADKTESATIYSEVSQVEETSVTTSNFNPGTMFVDVVKRVRPAIVTIYTTKNVKIPNNPFHDFFRQFRNRGDNRGDEGEREFQENGLGSGIIISSDGHILTNHHVIKDMDELKIKLIDGREADAEVLGTDPSTEVALIKIDLDDLASVNLGNSENLEIGEWVIAIGSPLELTSTVTAGIVSALSRDIPIIRNQTPTGIDNFIQTDAAINPGNSGGALVNLRGEVIGINTAIASKTGSYIGYGFAIPINIAKNVINDIINYGEVRRGYLGVYIENMDVVKAKGVGLEKPRGVLISSVIEDKAADNAGLEAGDVILKVVGLEVNKVNELQAKVASYDPGDEIDLVIWRDGRELTIEVELQGIDGTMTSTPANKKQEEKKFEKVGIQVRDLTSAQLNQMNLEYGIRVQSVERNSKASRAGLGPNEVIYEIDGKNVESVEDFEDYLQQFDSGDVVKLKVRRKDRSENFLDRLLFMEIP
ncbi:MAG: Do family serine endopeptidase [Calditrichia bacterium]|nr:Do family serine endopeptidase [Calditrichia bacterium]